MLGYGLHRTLEDGGKFTDGRTITSNTFGLEMEGVSGKFTISEKGNAVVKLLSNTVVNI